MIFDTMCGIRVDGENHFIIAPVPGGHFTHAGMSYDSVYGTVSCSWEVKENGSYSYDIVIPPNTTATVRIEGQETRELEAGRYSFGFLFSK